MTVVKKNIIANFVGSIWLAIMGLAFIPIYIKFLGVESWGLIGIFSTLQIVLSLLDLGLSSTLNREIARLSEINGKEQEINNLVRTLEVVYWCISVILSIIFFLLAPVIAEHWIRAENISQNVISQTIMIMGIITALQMPIGLYTGGLMGLQKHVFLNKINIIVGTLRGLGTVLILWLISRTILAFFIWQIVTSLLNFFLVYRYLWSYLPNVKIKATFEINLLKNIWKFAAGVSGISIFAVVLTQIDKIILSKTITLENFGYYILASTIAASMSRIVSPIFSSIYPKFTQLISRNEHLELIKFYHKICQFLSALLLPATMIISIFSYNIILIWTQNRILAENSHVVVSILIIGSAINGLMNPPYALQLAFNWTKLAFLKNLFSILFIAPLIFFLTINYGIIGAAIAWLILNIADFFFVIKIMHTKLLKNEKLIWYIYDVGLPFLVAITIAGLGWILMGKNFTQTMTIIYILSLTFLTYIGTFLITPTTRKLILQYYTNFKKRNDSLNGI